MIAGRFCPMEENPSLAGGFADLHRKFFSLAHLGGFISGHFLEWEDSSQPAVFSLPAAFWVKWGHFFVFQGFLSLLFKPDAIQGQGSIYGGCTLAGGVSGPGVCPPTYHRKNLWR